MCSFEFIMKLYGAYTPPPPYMPSYLNDRYQFYSIAQTFVLLRNLLFNRLCNLLFNL